MPHPQLIRLAGDHTPTYDDARRWFLGQGPSIAPVLVEGLEDSRLGSVGHWRILLVLRELALASTLPAIVRSLRSALASKNPIVMPGALQALAAFDTAETADAWASVLRSGEIDDVKHAAGLLGTIGDDRAVDLLIGLLTHQRPDVRRAAVRELANVDAEPAREALRRHRSGETDPGVLSEMDGDPS